MNLAFSPKYSKGKNRQKGCDKHTKKHNADDQDSWKEPKINAYRSVAWNEKGSNRCRCLDIFFSSCPFYVVYTVSCFVTAFQYTLDEAHCIYGIYCCKPYKGELVWVLLEILGFIQRSTLGTDTKMPAGKWSSYRYIFLVIKPVGIQCEYFITIDEEKQMGFTLSLLSYVINSNCMLRSLLCFIATFFKYSIFHYGFDEFFVISASIAAIFAKKKSTCLRFTASCMILSSA